MLLVEAVWRLLRWRPGWHARQKYLQKLKHGVSLKKKIAGFDLLLQRRNSVSHSLPRD
jgi:hypothetical protein